MTDRKLIILAHAEARRRAMQAVAEAPEGYTVRISPPAKSRDQEERYHAMIGDIAQQWTFCNRRWDAESMKRLLVDQFRRDTAKDPEFTQLWADMGTMEMAPSIDGSGVVALGWQTRKFPKKLASAFIEWLFAFGADTDIEWTDPKHASEPATA